MNWLNSTNVKEIGSIYIDTNLLSYGLIIGSLSIISFGI